MAHGLERRAEDLGFRTHDFAWRGADPIVAFQVQGLGLKDLRFKVDDLGFCV